jgi:hypothetical protein
MSETPNTPSTEARTYGPTYLGGVHDHPIWEELSDALDKAMTRHAPMHSPHEGHSVIREELDELWEHVRADTGRSVDARKEAIQIAAMGLRYALDLTEMNRG